MIIRMKRFFLPSILVLLFAFLCVLTSQVPAQTGVLAEDGTPRKSIKSHMRNMKYGLRKCFLALEAESQDQKVMLKQLYFVQRSAILAKNYSPRKVNRLAEEKREVFLKGYRKAMIQFNLELLELEKLILEENYSEAKVKYKNIKALMEPEHKKYRFGSDY